MEFDGARGGLSDINNTEIEMWDVSDDDDGDYMNGEGDDEESAVCSDGVNGPCTSVSGVRSKLNHKHQKLVSVLVEGVG